MTSPGSTQSSPRTALPNPQSQSHLGRNILYGLAGAALLGAGYCAGARDKPVDTTEHACRVAHEYVITGDVVNQTTFQIPIAQDGNASKGNGFGVQIFYLRPKSGIAQDSLLTVVNREPSALAVPGNSITFPATGFLDGTQKGTGTCVPNGTLPHVTLDDVVDSTVKGYKPIETTDVIKGHVIAHSPIINYDKE